MKIVVVGGGTAGLISALILKQTYPFFKIDVIRSEKIGTIGVGEGTTEHWQDFMNFVGITNGDIVKHCDATYKSGIMFQNWSKHDYLHSVESHFTDKYLDINFIYAYLISKNANPKDLVVPITWNSKVSLIDTLQKNIDNASTAQYHFNTHKLNDFLCDLCENRNIKIIDDEIVDVIISNTGEIEKIVGSKDYEYDFYIDSTGFKKLLIGKLGAEWQSYKQHLKMNSAIVFPTENTDYPMWTGARAMNAGWMFTIPVWERKGNGYIYCDEYINDNEAKKEVEELLGHKIKVAKKIKFDPGSLDKFWIKNCCAIGLSANFVEPLEATSIGTSIQQSFLLASKICNYVQEDINLYNKQVESIMENIKDFIFLHYMCDRTDTEFWQDVSRLDPPESLQKKLSMWQHRLPVDDDLIEHTDKILFKSANYLIVLYALNKIDISTIKSQFDHLPYNVQQYAENKIYEINQMLQTANLVDHKTVLSLVRECYK